MKSAPAPAGVTAPYGVTPTICPTMFEETFQLYFQGQRCPYRQHEQVISPVSDDKGFTYCFPGRGFVDDVKTTMKTGELMPIHVVTVKIQPPKKFP